MYINNFIDVFVYSKGIQEGENRVKIDLKALTQTIKMLGVSNKSIDTSLAINLAIQEEKSASLNKRFDDLYVLGGIILSLLFILIASVYIKSEKDVKAYLDQNFEEHTNQIQLKLDKASALLAEIETIRNLASKAKSSIQNDTNTNVE